MQSFSKKLFKLDSKQKERVLHIWTENADLNQESGLIDGGKVLHTKTCKGKNIGKSNETTPEKQAILEAMSKVEEKLSEGYFLSLEEAKTTVVVMPMLANNFSDRKDKINWNEQIFVQPKLDGMRCLIIVKDGNIRLMSRAGKDIITMQHIIDAIKPIISQTSNYILDGELYAHGLTFQENMRLLKKVKPGETEKICFHMYDIVSTKVFNERYNFVKLVVDKINSTSIKLVPTSQIFNESDLNTEHQKYLEQGYEGSMVRINDKGYESNKNSQSLLKNKDFDDVSTVIIDIIPNDANPLHGTPIFEIKGNKFKAGMKLPHEERAEWLSNKDEYIGKMAEIRFFGYSEDGIPRFPVCLGLRLDK